jgi:exonuclease III
MNILFWNARGLSATSKRRMLHDLICSNKIDIIAIQETKKSEFSQRMLRGINPHFDGTD